MKKPNKPHNPFAHLPKCGAKTRKGTPCQLVGMKNGRCRLHGGKSTGPKTAAGRARCGNWIHGLYSKAERERQQKVKQTIAQARDFLSELQ